MKLLLSQSACCLSLLLTAHSAVGQANQKPDVRLLSAANLSSLDTPGIRPWHLKIEATLFDEAGKHPQQGTIEVWHTDTDSLTTMNFGSATRILLKHNGAWYHFYSPVDVNYLSDAVLQAFVHPGPEASVISASQPEFRKEGSGEGALDCIMLSVPMKQVAPAPLGLFPTYCLSHDGNRLIASYDFGTQTAIRNGIGKFLEHEITSKLTLKMGKIIVATANLTTLATFTPTATQFEPTPEMQKRASEQASLSSGVMEGKILHKEPPVYPDSAKANHVSGAVVLLSRIGRDGRINALRPMSAPDPDLAASAMASVRKWTYTPYLLNGEPSEVVTTIVVNYNLNSLDDSGASSSHQTSRGRP